MNFLKKHAITIVAAIAGLGLSIATLAGATDPFASSFSALSAADLTAYAGYLFSDLWVVVALVIGVPLAFYVIRKVISLVRMH